MMSYKYARYISRVVRQPWAITPEKFAVLAELMRFRASGAKLSDQEIAARFKADDTDKPALTYMRAAAGSRTTTPGIVAVVPIHGTIANRADSFDASSGGTSTELIGRWLARVVADDTVTGIVLDIDSPGGSVEGVPELAAQIVAARAVKPVWAHVNALAASAGYWLASQADQIVVTPSGQVGSIGVFMLHVDESEALAKEGIKVTAISAGDYKLEGAPWAPLSEETKAFDQDQVDMVYRDFLSAVAKGRNVSVSDVKKNFGQGRVFDAKKAVALGMADRVGTIDDTYARVLSAGRKMAAAHPRPAVAASHQLEPEAFVGDPSGQAAAAAADDDGNSNCEECEGCRDCTNCTGCTNCTDCEDCTGCSGCTDCEDCQGCSGCTDCEDCSGCQACTGLRGAEGAQGQAAPLDDGDADDQPASDPIQPDGHTVPDGTVADGTATEHEILAALLESGL